MLKFILGFRNLIKQKLILKLTKFYSLKRTIYFAWISPPKQNLIVVILLTTTLSLLLNTDLSISAQEPVKTILDLHKFEEGIFNGRQTIIFQGKLLADSGERVSNTKIIIKNDGPCPNDNIIAEGITDKHGRFWISTIEDLG